ncbi:hypothetical protein BG000_006529, partial [Podila horticola]
PKSRWPSRTKEEKLEANELLLNWRKKEYEEWVRSKPYRVGSETWILPDNALKELSTKFSGARTAEAVKFIALSCKWMPFGAVDSFGKIATILDKLNNEIEARRGTDQLGDVIEGDGEGRDDEEYS